MRGSSDFFSRSRVFFFPALILGCLVTAGRAGTYEEWEAAAPLADGALRLEFWDSADGPDRTESINDRKSSSPTESIYWKVPASPFSEHLGYLHWKQAGVERVRLIFREVLTDDLVPADRTARAGWLDGDRLIREAPLRAAWRVEEFSDVSKKRVPVGLFQPSAGWSGGTETLLSLSVELMGSGDRILGRKILVGVYSARNAMFRRGYQRLGWIFGDEEVAERRLNLLVDPRQSHRPEAAVLPEADEALLKVDGIWMTEEVLNALSPKRVRELCLAGLWLTGPDEVVEAARSRAGLKRSVHLFGAVATAQQDPSWNEFFGDHISRDSWESQRNVGDEEEALSSLFPAEKDLFAELKTFLAWLTGLVAGFYVLASSVLLPWLFFRWSGEARLRLWWLVPGSAVVVSVLTIALYHLLAPGHDQVDIREYRMAHLSFPEGFSRTLVKAHAAEGDRIVYRIEGYAVPLPAEDHSASTWLKREIFRSGTEATELADRYKITRGKRIAHQFAAWKSWPHPVERTGSQSLKALIPLEKVTIFTDGEFHDLGAMEAGEEKSVSGKGKDSAGLGYVPNLVASAFSRHSRNRNGSLTPVELWEQHLGGDWLIFVRDGGARPMVSYPGGGAQVDSRVFWILQASDPGGGADDERGEKP